MSRKLNMSRGGSSWSCEVIKSAHLSSGHNIYLLRRDVSGSYSSPFVVGVRLGDSTLEYKVFDSLKVAIMFYVDILACYA